MNTRRDCFSRTQRASRFITALLTLWIAGIQMVSGVEPGKPSVTALIATANRAVGARNPDVSMRNPDFLAEKFLGPEERAILGKWSPERAQALGMDFERASQAFGSIPAGVARTRFFDAMFLDAVRDGARQIVDLGAGLDSRAYRFQDRLSGLKVFEVDFPPMQEYKKRRVREILGALPGHVVYVPIDFTKEDLGTVLKRGGYRPDLKTFFVWEAVTMYLPEEAVSATLRFVAQNSAPGSLIALNYSLRGTHDTGTAKRFEGYGEPLLYGFPSERTKEFLAEQGLQMELDLGPEEMTKRYLTRPGGSVFGRASTARYCTAVVPARSAQPRAAGGLPVARPEEIGMSSERLGRVRAMIQRYIDREQIAGAVSLIARRGRVVHFEAQGFMDLESRKPMQKDTVFALASMTKPITSTAIMMLLEEGRFQLNDPVSRLIPEFKKARVAGARAPGERAESPLQTAPASFEITIRHLLTHTSGLPGAGDLPSVTRPGSLASWIAHLASLPLGFEPGAAWNYGQSTLVLGRLVEAASGMPLDRFFEERIFRPLGMTDTYLFPPEPVLARVATRYRPKTPAGGLEPRPRPALNTNFPNGSTGLRSTAADYFRFCQMSLNGGHLNDIRLLSRKSIEAMTINQIGDLKAKPIVRSGEEVLALPPGVRFGLGYGVLTDLGAWGELGSVGSYWWAGSDGTMFWVDPREQMIGILMFQLSPHRHLGIRQEFRTLATAAIVD